MVGGLLGDDPGRVADGDCGVLERVGTVWRRKGRRRTLGLNGDKRSEILAVCMFV